jgi:hypothetical protein
MLLNRSPLYMQEYTTGIFTHSACEPNDDAITARPVVFSRVYGLQTAYRSIDVPLTVRAARFPQG